MKFVVCVTFILLFTDCSNTQTKTVKGNCCENSPRNRGGGFGFRFGSRVMTFQMNFGQTKDNANTIRFNVNKLKVGNESIVKYNPEEFIVAITGISKSRKIEPFMLE